MTFFVEGRQSHFVALIPILTLPNWFSAHTGLRIGVLLTPKHSRCLAGLMIGLPTVVAIVLSHVNRMLYGTPSAEVRVGEGAGWSLVPLALCLSALVVLGLTIPAPLERLVAQVVEITAK